MSKVIICQEGIVLEEFNRTTGVAESKILYDIKMGYNSEVEIEDGMTLDRFMTLLKPHFEVIDQDFYSFSATGHKMINFYKEMKENPPAIEPKYDYLCFEKQFNINIGRPIDEPTKKNINLENFVEFVAIQEKDGTKIHHSIDFEPLSQMKNLPIKIENKIEIRINDFDILDGKLSLSGYDNVETTYSLYEILGAFVYLVTFYGYPENREEVKEQMLKTSEKIHEILQNIKNEVFGPKMSFAEFELETLKKQLIEEEENENYLACAKIREKIKQIEEKNETK